MLLVILTGNADTATTLATARTISLSGDVAGSASFDGSGDITITTTAQIDSIALGTDTTGDYVESMSGGTGVTVTGGTGEGSTPSIAIGQAVATTDDVTFNSVTAPDFIGDLHGAVRFPAKADGALSKGDVVYISGVTGNNPTVAKAKADDASKMPAFGLAASDANDNASVSILTFGTLSNIDTSQLSVGQILYVSTTAGEYTTTPPSGESAQIQNIGKVQRSHANAGSIKVGGAGRSNATPNLDDGKIFIGNASNQSSTATLDTSIVVENTNLYYTQARFDSAFTAKDTDDLSEGTNLYYTDARFDTRLATKDTDDLSEGTTNLYYTDARANSAIDTRVTKAFVDALNIQAASVDANSVALGTDTTGNYIQTITGTANKITVTGSGSESADVTLTLPDDVQIADSLTVAGNLTVNGTLTSLDTTNLDIEDNLFQLNAGLTGSPVNDSGMLINRGNQDNGIFMWDESVDKFTLGLTTADGTSTGNITLNSLGTLVANIEGDVTGAVTGTVSSLSNHDTGDLAEGTNLYYTDARFDTRLATKDTDDLSEGSSNLYYTTARFDSAFTGKSTSDLSEGTNLYYTSARANSDFDTRLATKDTGDLAEGTNLYYTDARAQAVSINNVVEDTTPQLGGDLASNGNDILFADNDKAIFGAGSDLQIYHNGTGSYVDEQGTGVLYIRGSAGVYIMKYDNTETLASFLHDDGVYLYHNNLEKFKTTSTGIDVTGTVTADGLTVNSSEVLFDNTGGDFTLKLNTNAVGDKNEIIMGDTGTPLAKFGVGGTANDIITGSDGQDFNIGTAGGGRAINLSTDNFASVEMKLDGGNLGIGTSPSYKLDVDGDINIGDGTLRLETTSSGFPSTGLVHFSNNFLYQRGGSAGMIFSTAGGTNEALRFNSSGQVIINGYSSSW